ncbi:MAG: DNA repair protein RecO [Chloroflexi bacterium]|nr:MAG: DNA repair protein RecO [Chloroflexota bacterium]
MPRPQRAFRTQALILKRRDFGEADRMLTILTPSHGKIEVVAHGARKLTSSKTGHVELFTCADMLIHNGRNFGIVAQAEMVTPYQPLREDLQRGAYANYVAELADRFSTLDEPDDSSLFTLLSETFERLSIVDDPRLAIRYYEIRLLDVAGFRPELNECVFGREAIEPEDQFFSYAEGGVVCPRHANQSVRLTRVSLNALKILRHLQRSSYAHIAALTIDAPLHNEVERILLGYITYQLERKLQSIDFIKRIRSI